jgi:hypothetical protein
MSKRYILKTRFNRVTQTRQHQPSSADGKQAFRCLAGQRQTGKRRFEQVAASQQERGLRIKKGGLCQRRCQKTPLLSIFSSCLVHANNVQITYEIRMEFR